MHHLLFEMNGGSDSAAFFYVDVLALRRGQIQAGGEEYRFAGGSRPNAIQLRTLARLVALREDGGSSFESALANGVRLLVEEDGVCSGMFGDAVVVLAADGRWRANFGSETYETVEEALAAAVESADEEEAEKDRVSGSN